MKHLRSARLVTIAALGALLVAGCGSRDPQASAGTGQKASGQALSASLQQPTSLPVTEPVKGHIPTGKTIALLFSGTDQAAVIRDGIKAAAAVLGWKLAVFTFDPADPPSLMSAATSAIASRPAAILGGPLSAAQIQPIAQAAKAAAIPVVTFRSSASPMDGVYPTYTNETQTTYMAELIAGQLINDAASAGVKAHVLQLTVPEFAEAMGVVDNAVGQKLKQCDGCTHELLRIPLGDVFAGKGVEAVISELQKHPDINYVVADAAQLAIGLDSALQQAGRTDVKIFGALPSAAQLQSLAGGGAGAWVTDPIGVDGWAMVDEVARLLTGDTTNPWKDAKLAYVITKDNVTGVDTKDPEFPKGYQNAFKKMWSIN